MSKFLKVKTAEDVLHILSGLQPLPAEEVALETANGRVVAAPIAAPEPAPHFERATMDGYAVRAKDTFGASESLPALLETAGEIAMGQRVEMRIEAGKAIGIPTGGMLPRGGDAVVMVEYINVMDEKTIEVTKPVAPGDNVLKIGEDVAQGELLFPAGWELRPQDIGVLAALGVSKVSVYRRPRVAILATGDEVVPVGTNPLPPGKIRDVNTYSLAAQVEEAGAVVGLRETVEDHLESLVETCKWVLADHDVILLSGGSSVGVRDYTIRVLEALPDAELLVHGVAVRPGKPTIFGRAGGKLFWGLPGQPVSAMMICKAFVEPSLALLGGLREEGGTAFLGKTCEAVLSRQLPSVTGRADYVPVALTKTRDGMLAAPVFGKSAMINILSRADGYVIIPTHVEGLDRGTFVTVHLFANRQRIKVETA